MRDPDGKWESGQALLAEMSSVLKRVLGERSEPPLSHSQRLSQYIPRPGVAHRQYWPCCVRRRVHWPMRVWRASAARVGVAHREWHGASIDRSGDREEPKRCDQGEASRREKEDAAA